MRARYKELKRTQRKGNRHTRNAADAEHKEKNVYDPAPGLRVFLNKTEKNRLVVSYMYLFRMAFFFLSFLLLWAETSLLERKTR